MGGDDRTFRSNYTDEEVARLREQVEEKLKEFMGDYTDDTLVEYVIVLLKNGRRKDEAKSELDVFLGDDSDSFVTWLWDHLGSHLTVYVQPQESDQGGASKRETAGQDPTGRSEPHQITSEPVKENSGKTAGHHCNREWKGLMRDEDRESSERLESHKTKSESGKGKGKGKFDKSTVHCRNREVKGLVRNEDGELSERLESHKTESGKGKFDKPIVHRLNREWKGLVRDEDENAAPLTENSVAHKVNAQDDQRRVREKRRSLSPRRTIQKTRRRQMERQLSKKDVSQATGSAPRRLLQFALRDAVAPAKPTSTSVDPSFKRLRSVVSTSKEDLFFEEQPKRIRSVPRFRTALSAAIKASAVEDTRKVRTSRNIFDRLGVASDVPYTTNDHEDHRVVAEQENIHFAEDVVGGEYFEDKEDVQFAEDVVGGEYFADRGDIQFSHHHHHHHHHQNGSDIWQNRNTSNFHDESIVDSVLGYEDEGFETGHEDIDISQTGTAGGNWVEEPLMFPSSEANDFINNDRVDKLHGDMDQAVAAHDTYYKFPSFENTTIRKVPRYQDVVRASVEGGLKLGQDSYTMADKAGVLLLKEKSNPRVAINGNAKLETDSPYETQKTQTSTNLSSTDAPAEDADSRTIFVSNVHFAATKDNLSRHFNKFGEVLKVIILTDPATGQPKGSAYIEFTGKEAAKHALSLNGTSFMSRILKIARKSSAQPEAAAASVTAALPRIARASPFTAPRFGRASFTRGAPNLYRPPRLPVKPPGARNFQWKRGAAAQSIVTEGSGQQALAFPPPPISRSLTYVRPEPKHETKTN